MTETLSDYYQRSESGLMLKSDRPKTLGDAKKLIAVALKRQPWDEDAIRRYFKGRGSQATKIDDLTNDEIRTIITDMEKSRMLVFKD